MQQPRYLKQRDDYSCAPIAIMNMLKWAGQKISYKKRFKQIHKLCKCGKDGSHGRDYQSALLQFAGKRKVWVRFVPCVEIDQIDKHLREDGALLLSYVVDDDNNHIFFIFSSTGKTYSVVNLWGRTVIRIRRKTLEVMLFRSFCLASKQLYPKAWFLKKEQQDDC